LYIICFANFRGRTPRTPPLNPPLVMVSMLALSVVDSEFEPRSDKTKNFKIGMCCFSAKHYSRYDIQQSLTHSLIHSASMTDQSRNYHWGKWDNCLTKISVNIFLNKWFTKVSCDLCILLCWFCLSNIKLFQSYNS
jgi:hypothetical protein